MSGINRFRLASARGPRRSAFSLGVTVRWVAPLSAIFAALTLGSCYRTLPLRLPSGVPIEVNVRESHNRFILEPNSDRFRQLELWVQQNQSGWSRYRVTAAACGICVSAGDVQLNFLGSSVIVYSKDGGWQKPVGPSEYAFLNLSRS